MGLIDNILELTKLKAKRSKKKVEEWVKKELKKEQAKGSQ